MVLEAAIAPHQLLLNDLNFSPNSPDFWLFSLKCATQQITDFSKSWKKTVVDA